MARGSC